MKTKRSLFLLAFISLIQTSFAQSLSKAAIKDFARNCEFQVQYNQNQNYLLVALMQYISGKVGGANKAYLSMISTETDKQARETVFDGFNSLSGGSADKLNSYLFNWGLSPLHAKEITNYIESKYRKIEGKESIGIFQGTKIFEDEEGVYSREVTIKGSDITVKLFAGSRNANYTGKTQLLGVEKGYIKNGKVFIKDGKNYRSDLYRIENGKLVVNYDTGD